MPGVYYPVEVIHTGPPDQPPTDEVVQLEVAVKVPLQVPLEPGLYTIRSCHDTFVRGHPGGEGAKVNMQVSPFQISPFYPALAPFFY